MSQSYSKRSLETYWMLIMSVIAIILSATFMEGWTSIAFIAIAGIIYILTQVGFWWYRWKHQLKGKE